MERILFEEDNQPGVMPHQSYSLVLFQEQHLSSFDPVRGYKNWVGGTLGIRGEIYFKLYEPVTQELLDEAKDMLNDAMGKPQPLGEFIPYSGGDFLIPSWRFEVGADDGHGGPVDIMAPKRYWRFAAKFESHGPCWLIRRERDANGYWTFGKAPDGAAQAFSQGIPWQPTTRPLIVAATEKATCPDCRGSGLYVGFLESEPCQLCGGKGVI